MTVNRIVNLLAIVWLAMVVMSFLHPMVASPKGGDFDRYLDRLIYFAAWQGTAMLPAFALLVLRFALQERLSGSARWLAWVPPIFTLIAIVGLVIFGHIAR